jgi:hypothetical protein
MASLGFLERTLVTSGLASARLGTITGSPLPFTGVLPGKSSRNPALRAAVSGPWHGKHFAARIGWMWREKSTAEPAAEVWSAVTGIKTKMPALVVQRMTPPIVMTLVATKRLGAVESLRNGPRNSGYFRALEAKCRLPPIMGGQFGGPPVGSGSEGAVRLDYTLNLKSRTSPSWTMYSLPSMR